MILVPNKNLLVPKHDAAFDIAIKPEGWLKMVCHKVNAHGEIVSSRVAADWFPNLITNGGMDRMGANNGATAYCHVGTGTATPTTGDTALASFLASSNTVPSGTGGNSIVAGPPRYASGVSARRFAAGVAAGVLAEVGFSWTGTTGNLFNRALIRDGGGSPTTITVLSDEILDVYLETRVYIPSGDSSGTVINISGTDYTFVRRAANNTTFAGGSSPGWGIDNGPGSFTAAGWGSGVSIPPATLAYNGSMGAENTSPSGSSSGPGTVNTNSYTNGTYQRSGSYQWGLSEGNLSGGISALRIATNWGVYQFSVSPAIAKNNTQTLVLNVNQTWARH